MGYMIQAILAAGDILTPAPSWIADSQVVALSQNIAMIPITEALYDQFLHEHTMHEENPFCRLTYLSLPIATRLAELSKRGTVAYIEAEYFGGIGEQWAVVWREGKVLIGPLHTPGRGAINQALHLLGVPCRGRTDEFDVVGLFLHRFNEEWLHKSSE